MDNPKVPPPTLDQIWAAQAQFGPFDTDVLAKLLAESIAYYYPGETPGAVLYRDMRKYDCGS